KYVDVGRPEVEAVKNGRATGTHRLLVDHPSLDADVVGHLVDAGDIERGGKTDGLREFRRAIDRDAMESLAPPVVFRYAEPRNGTGAVDELRDFLLQRHA